MKKFIAIALLLALCLGLVACGTPAEKEPAKSGLEDAVAYLKGMYKSAKENKHDTGRKIMELLDG